MRTLSLSDDQIAIIAWYAARRERKEQNIEKMALPLSSDQETRITELLQPLIRKWEPIYNSYHQRINQFVSGTIDGGSGKPGSRDRYYSALPRENADKELNERDLTDEERLAVYLAFNCDFKSLNTQSKKVLTWLFFFLILGQLNQVWNAGGIDGMLTTTAPSGISGQDAFNEMLGIALPEEYARYDYTTGYQAITLLSTALLSRARALYRDNKLARDTKLEYDRIHRIAEQLEHQGRKPSIEDITRAYNRQYTVKRAMTDKRTQFLMNLTVSSEVSLNTLLDDSDSDSKEHGDSLTYSTPVFPNPEEQYLIDESIEERWYDWRNKLSLSWGRKRGAEVAKALRYGYEYGAGEDIKDSKKIQDITIETAAEYLVNHSKEKKSEARRTIESAINILSRSRKSRRPVHVDVDFTEYEPYPDLKEVSEIVSGIDFDLDENINIDINFDGNLDDTFF